MDQTQEQLLQELRAEKESLQRLLKSPEWGLLVKFVKAQNLAREHLTHKRITSTEEGYQHNYEVGFIHGQRSVITLPQSIIAIRGEEFRALLIEDQENDRRTNR